MKGTWVRLGIQQTPFVDYAEGIYRYRFQGTTFTERERVAAISLVRRRRVVPHEPAVELRRHPRRLLQRRGLQQGRGERPEGVPDPRHRAAVRASSDLVARGLRVTAFYNADHYIENAERTRICRERHLRAHALQRRLRLPRRQGSDLSVTATRRREQRLVVLGDAVSLKEKGNGIEGAVPIRHIQAQSHRARAPEARPDDRRRRLLVPASRRRRDGRAAARLRTDVKFNNFPKRRRMPTQQRSPSMG